MKKLLSIIIAVVTAVVMTLTFTACEQGPEKYTISYNANGGTIEVDSFEYTVGEAFELKTPTYAGYTFDGWFMGEEEVTTETVFTGDTTIVAKWTANTYKINYVLNGEAYASENVTYNTAYTVKSAPSMNAGYHFTGWKRGGATFTSGTYTVAGDTQIVGSVIANVASVTFELFNSENDVTLVNGMNGVSLTTGDDLPTCAFEVEGKNGVIYEFAGWTLDSLDDGVAPTLLTSVVIESDGVDLVFRAVYKASRL